MRTLDLDYTWQYTWNIILNIYLTVVTCNKKLQIAKNIPGLMWVYFLVLNTYVHFLCAHLVVKVCSMSAEHRTIKKFIVKQCKTSLPDLDNI